MNTHNNYRRVLLGVSIMALSTAASSALAQSRSTGGKEAEVEEIIVTGTAFRGVQPVGSNLISVGADEIKKSPSQTLQNVWKTIPALSNMGAVNQGNTGGGNNYSAPTIHNLGSSSSNSTLVLIDGHRFAPSTIQQALMDPGIVPVAMVERVEVLTDGASSTYGADAVAGVLNVITRRRYDGLQISAQSGVGDSYNTYSGSLLFGRSWDNAALVASGSYSYASDLPASARVSDLNFIPRGGTNNNNFFCDPATLQPTGSPVYFLGVNAAAGTPTAQSGAMCNAQDYSSLLQAEERLNGMVRYSQDLGEAVRVNLDVIVGMRNNERGVPRGNLQSTAFATGARANPFYTNPAAYTGAATTQTVRWSADELLGPGAMQTDRSFSVNFHAGLDWDISDKWHAAFMAVAGHDDTKQRTTGTLCAACVNLALNGTTNTSGNATTPSIPGTAAIAIQTLTTQNALDVWRPAATNRTSDAVRRLIADNVTYTPFDYYLQQYRGTLDGSLFSLPAGDVHLAVGGEVQLWDQQATYVTPSGIGPSSTGASIKTFPLSRDVWATYAELLVPLIGPEMGIPFIQKATVDVAARYDHYSDFGGTSNPKIGIDWEVFDGLKFHANWASSFVAPQLIQVGDPARNYQGNSRVGPNNATFIVDANAFPSVIGLPGCSAAQVAAAQNTCSVGSAVTGVMLFGNLSPAPATGKTWSVGMNFSPSFIPGLRMDVNLFNNKLENMLTSTNVSQALGAPSLGLIQFFPNGLTQAQLDAAVPPFYDFQGVLPPPSQLYYVLNNSVKNFLFLTVQGFDISVNYSLPTDNYGEFRVGGNGTVFTKFDQQFKGNPNVFSVLGTTGFNGTIGSIKAQGRFYAGWEKDAFQATLFMNYVSEHKNWSGSTVTPLVLVNRVPDHGGDTIDASYLFDLNASYSFTGVNWWGADADSEVFVNITNLFDEPPSFSNGGNGFDIFSGNPVGRVVSAGLRVTF